MLPPLPAQPNPAEAACFHRGPVLAEHKGLTAIDCAECGYAHLHPMPALPGTREPYEDEFREEVRPNRIADNRTDADWLELEAQMQYEESEKRLLPGMECSLPDAGSGSGHFLHTGQQRRWMVQGVKSSRMAWQCSIEQLGLPVVNGYSPSEATKALPKFAVTGCKKVLEYIADREPPPRAMRDMTLPGGLMCVSVPNESNPLPQAFVADSGREEFLPMGEDYTGLTPAQR